MWTCPKCGRIFRSANQPHSCQKVPLEKHFKNKEKARELFSYLVEQVKNKIGECKIISIPCCVHLFGKYDFLAALPKKDRLEIRFALDRKLDSPRLKQSVQMSSKVFKNFFDISS
jgi:two-component SAPR family response regulator